MGLGHARLDPLNYQQAPSRGKTCVSVRHRASGCIRGCLTTPTLPPEAQPIAKLPTSMSRTTRAAGKHRWQRQCPPDAAGARHRRGRRVIAQRSTPAGRCGGAREWHRAPTARASLGFYEIRSKVGRRAARSAESYPSIGPRQSTADTDSTGCTPVLAGQCHL